jgi:putative phosphoesterase
MIETKEKVKILHISDVHCNKHFLSEVLKKEDSDLVILSGDIECYDLIEVLENINDRLLAVTGNMDDISILRGLRDLNVLIDGKVVKRHNLLIGGVGGLDPITSLEELKQNISRSQAKIDILVSHHPPKGAVDKTLIGLRAGLEELRDFVIEHKPKLHLCGHIHEARGIEKLGETLVVNPGPLKRGYYAIITFKGNKVNAELKRL